MEGEADSHPIDDIQDESIDTKDVQELKIALQGALLENKHLKRTIRQMEEKISGLRVKVFTLSGQLSIQKKLLNSELQRQKASASVVTNALVNDMGLDALTQNWLATEFVDPGQRNEQDEESDHEEEDQVQTKDTHADPLPRIAEDGVESTNPSAPVAHQLTPSDEIVNTNSDVNTDKQETIQSSSTDQQLTARRFSTNGQRLTKMNSIIRTTVNMMKSRKRLFSLSFSTEIRPQIPTTVLSELRMEDFDVFGRSTDELKKCILYIFEDLGLIESFMIKPSVLFNFLGHMQEEYRDNPYHNFQHAMDVTQTVYTYLIRTNARDILQPIDVLGLMVSAISHDVGHPGQNNAFHINTQSELARIYNDTSVLESYHAAKTFEVLRKHEYPSQDITSNPGLYLDYVSKKMNGAFDANPLNPNVLQSLSNVQYKEIRKNMVNMILSTDMARHFDMTAKLSSISKKAESEDVLLSADSKEDRDFLCSVLLHCADISNVTKPFDIGKVWSDRVRDEFFRQGDLEKACGLPVSPFMDREDSNQARTTLNFIDFVAAPLFTTLAVLVQGLESTCQSLISNRAKWQQILEEKLVLPDSTGIPDNTSSNEISQSSLTKGVHNRPSSQGERPDTQKKTITSKTLEDEKEVYRRRSSFVLSQVKQMDELFQRRMSRSGSIVVADKPKPRSDLESLALSTTALAQNEAPKSPVGSSPADVKDDTPPTRIDKDDHMELQMQGEKSNVEISGRPEATNDRQEPSDPRDSDARAKPVTFSFGASNGISKNKFSTPNFLQSPLVSNISHANGHADATEVQLPVVLRGKKTSSRVKFGSDEGPNGISSLQHNWPKHNQDNVFDLKHGPNMLLQRASASPSPPPFYSSSSPTEADAIASNAQYRWKSESQYLNGNTASRNMKLRSGASPEPRFEVTKPLKDLGKINQDRLLSGPIIPEELRRNAPLLAQVIRATDRSPSPVMREPILPSRSVSTDPEQKILPPLKSIIKLTK